MARSTVERSHRVEVSASADPSRGRRPFPTILLEGRVQGNVVPLEATRIEIDVSAPHLAQSWREKHLRLHAGRDGLFRVDLTPAFWFDGVTSIPNRLIVRGHHGPWSSVQVEVRIRSESAITVPVTSLPAGPIVVTADLELRRCTEVTGSAAALSGSAPITVAAFEMIDGQPSADSSAAARVGSNGIFRMGLPPGCEFAIVAASAGLRPGTVHIVVADAPVQRLPALLLDAGERIAGRVLLDSDPPPRGTSVYAVHAGSRGTSVQRMPFGGPALGWTEGRFELLSASAKTGDGGSFVLAGLAPARYQVRPVCAGAPGAELRAATSTEVAAPASDVTIGPLLARVEVHVTGRPLLGSRHEFRIAEGWDEEPSDCSRGPFAADEAGRARLWLPPLASHTLVLGGSHSIRALFPFRTPRAGEALELAVGR